MNKPSQPQYEVIIVGGRPAGASLAARLGQQNIKTLIVDRAAFPSRPAVSTPFILAHTMQLLDEIGANEADYAYNTPKMHQVVLEFKDNFRVFFPMSEKGGRNYLYTIERGRFDHSLWRNLDKFESVTALENFAVTDLLRDENGRVMGITGRHPQSEQQTFVADCVVGADGRFSTVAQKVNAPITEQRTDVDTTIYYAFWENVAPYDETGQPMPHIHTSLDGFSYVFMPTADDLVSVVVQGQSHLYDPQAGHVDDEYLRRLQAQPYVWRRLKNARQVTQLSGMKRMGNLFRQAAGPGWALVGDAYHQKDSIDAQGIYDALIGAKYLAEALIAWREGQDWDEAMQNYGKNAYSHLKPMFDATMDRVKREIYDIPPPFVAKTILKWVLTSDEYKTRFRQVLVRDLNPEGWLAPAVMVKMLLSGMNSSLQYRLQQKPNPVAMPPITTMPQN